MKSVLRLLLVSLILCAPVAHADDWGCEVLLCLSNPKGPTAVGQCIPPIKKLWRELAKGHAFPTCFMGGSSNGNGAQHSWASASNCPPQYVRYQQDDYRTPYCLYSGVVTTTVNGEVSSRTWWGGEESVTEYLGSQRAQAGDTKFSDDRAAYDANQN